MPLINLSNTDNFAFWYFWGNSGNQTWDCWVRSKCATSVLCSPPPSLGYFVWIKRKYKRAPSHSSFLKAKLPAIYEASMQQPMAKQWWCNHGAIDDIFFGSQFSIRGSSLSAEKYSYLWLSQWRNFLDIRICIRKLLGYIAVFVQVGNGIYGHKSIRAITVAQ